MVLLAADTFSDTTVSILVQAGATGLGLVALALVYFSLKILSNHLVHVAQALGEAISELHRLTMVIDKLADRTLGVPVVLPPEALGFPTRKRSRSSQTHQEVSHE